MIAPMPARARQLAAAAAEALRRAMYGDEAERESIDPFERTAEFLGLAFGAQAITAFLVLAGAGPFWLLVVFLVAGLYSTAAATSWHGKSARFNNEVCKALMRLSRHGALRRAADAYDAEQEEVPVSH